MTTLDTETRPPPSMDQDRVRSSHIRLPPFCYDGRCDSPVIRLKFVTRLIGHQRCVDDESLGCVADKVKGIAGN
jgi:hypothetical protein